MKNAFARMGRTCVSMLIASGLTAVGVFAASPNPVTIQLPHSVEVGSVTLPTGEYTIQSMPLSTGDVLFIVRSGHKDVVTLQAHRTIEDDASGNTKVAFTTAGDAWHFDKLFIEGEFTAYEFAK